MDIQRCYAVLELSEKAGPDELKSSYRRLAFACHPDLHPEDPGAAEKFQALNEAYVTLLNHLEAAGQAGTKGPSAASGPQQARDRHRAGSRRKPGQRGRTDSRNGSVPFGSAGGKAKSQEGFKREEILKNILKDPFAKQVFEDIFRTVKQRKPEEPGRIGRSGSGRTISLPLGKRALQIELSRLSPRRLKKWFQSQLDHEQTLYLSPSRLLPGTTISITVRRGLGDGAETVTATIPPDYTAGRPLRLKGLGRRLGPWSGDLYLRLLAK